MYNWRPGDAKLLEEVAKKSGVKELVEECPERISYRRSLEILLESDGALILGVDDTGYMPSKLFTYALSGKPLLASLRQDGPAFDRFKFNSELGQVLWFDQYAEMPVEKAASVLATYLQAVAIRKHIDRRMILEPFLAPAMASRHVDLFEACLCR